MLIAIILFFILSFFYKISPTPSQKSSKCLCIDHSGSCKLLHIL